MLLAYDTTKDFNLFSGTDGDGSMYFPTPAQAGWLYPIICEFNTVSAPYSNIGTGYTGQFGKRNDGGAPSEAWRLRSRTLGFFGDSARTCAQMRIDTTNPSAKHWLGTGWKMNNTDNTSLKRLVAAWNTGLEPFTFGWGAVFPSNFEGLFVTPSTGLLSVNGVSGTAIISAGTWYWIDIGLDPAIGTVEIWVNGVLDITTTMTALTTVRKVGFTAGVDKSGVDDKTADFYFNAFYFLDATGTEMNSKLGQVSIQRAPISSVVQQDTTVSGTGTAASILNASDVQTVNSLFGTNQAPSFQDSFLIDASGVSGTIKAVVVRTYAKKTTLAKIGMDLVAKDTVEVSAPAYPVQIGEYKNAKLPLALFTAPDGSPWSSSNLAATEFGYLIRKT